MPRKQPKMEMIDELLDRGVEQILPTKEKLKEALLAGKPLRVKHGIDPTGTKIHIGRAIVEWKLKQFQDLGHKIVLIIGDFTAQIGDPSDKLEKRPFLSKDQVKKNLKNYLPQIGRILNLKKTEVRYNSEWLSKLDLQDTSHLMEQFTFQQMMQRRNFKERWKNDSDITLRELLYPMMQGYDSVAVRADVELGGTDQLFNLLAGRKVQERYGQKPQFVMTTKMLEGLDGRKMSTSWGNVINITDEPIEQYGKIMSMRDEVMQQYFELATGMPLAEISDLMRTLKNPSTNPKTVKERLAFELVRRYHGENAAKKAAEKFTATFTRKETPNDITEISLTKFVAPSGFFADKLFSAGLCASKSEARRLLQEGAVKKNGQKIVFSGHTLQVDLKKGDVIQIGKRKFVRVV